VLAGLILGAIAAFIIDRKFEWAALFAGAAVVLSFLALSTALRSVSAARFEWQ